MIGPVLAGALIGAGLSTRWLGLLMVGLVLAAVGALALRRGLDPTVDGRTAAAVGG